MYILLFNTVYNSCYINSNLWWLFSNRFIQHIFTLLFLFWKMFYINKIFFSIKKLILYALLHSSYVKEYLTICWRWVKELIFIIQSVKWVHRTVFSVILLFLKWMVRDGKFPLKRKDRKKVRRWAISLLKMKKTNQWAPIKWLIRFLLSNWLLISLTCRAYSRKQGHVCSVTK